jgi:hypothetical protein
MFLFIGEKIAATWNERLAICVESGGSGKFVDIASNSLPIAHLLSLKHDQVSDRRQNAQSEPID